MFSTSSTTHQAPTLQLLLLPLLAVVVQLPSTLAQVTSCSPGSYLSSGSCITCTDYTLGECPGGISPQTACAAGQSPIYNFSACVTTPTTCSDGYLLIAYSQASVCQPCFLPLSNGNFANNICINNVSTTCASSTFANANATQCVTGISLTYGTPGCRFGEYIGNRVCRTCPDNRVCVGNFFPPYACGSGKVLSADKTTCIWDRTTTCPAGTWAPISIAGPVGEVTDPYCMTCPTNSICLGGTAMPSLCPAGSWPNSNRSATSCIVQTSCFPGTFLQNGGCPPCPPGYFCPGGIDQPTTCPPGLYPANINGVNAGQNADTSGMSTCSLPSTCKIGMFKNSTGCWTCPLGAVCAGGTASFITCPNAQSCPSASTCTKGSFNENGVCYKCVNDYFLCSGGSSTATAIPEGYYSGTYTNYYPTVAQWDNTQTFPYRINTGTFNDHYAVPLPTSCPVGTYLQIASASCPLPTSICDKRGCLDCPPGHVCTGGTSAPVQCTGGTIPNWNTTLGAAKSFCVQPDVSCPPGYASTAMKTYYNQVPGYFALSGLVYQPSCVVSPDKLIPNYPTTDSPTIFTDVAPGGFVPPLSCQVLYSANNDNTRCVLTTPPCPPGTYSTSDPNSPLLRNPLFSQNAYGYGPGWITTPSKCISCEDSLRYTCPGGNHPAPRVSCPNGHIRSANFTTCVPAAPLAVNGRCNAGSYQTGWMATYTISAYFCQQCPEGSACGGYSDEPVVKCGAGKVSTANAAICDWGYPNTCSSTSNSNSSSCVWDGVTSCPAGTYGSSASRLDAPYCQPCPMFAICAGGSALPVGCPFGTGPDSTSTSCVVSTSCSAGMYLSSGRCLYCPVGYSCAGGSADPVLCPFNLVPMDANNKPAIPTTEKENEYVAIGERQGGFPAVTCGVPPFCPVNYFLNTTGCWPCPPGLTCQGGAYYPRNCTGLSSTYCTAPAQPVVCTGIQIRDLVNSPTTCINPKTTCNSGSYLLQSLCWPCPNGAICPGGTDNFTMCAAGKWPVNNQCQDIPTSCTPGNSIGAEVATLRRPLGFIWTGGVIPAYKMVCTYCRTALLCPGGFAPARHCPEHISPNINQTECATYNPSCPLGYKLASYNGNGGISSLYWSFYSNSIYSHGKIGGGNRPSQESFVCEKCQSTQLCPGGFNNRGGIYCPFNTQPSFNQTVCLPTPSCPAGQKSAFGVCSPCPTGPFYCPGGTSSETSCGTGKVPNAGATACVWDNTTICAAGTYINPSTTSTNSYCAACTAGSYCLGGSSAPVACAAGQIVNSGATACSPCPSGSYCTGGSSPATACGSGKAPNAGATACEWDNSTICTAGTYINPSTASNTPYCTTCTSGFSCAGGSAAPVGCVAGEVVNSGATACSPCPSGFACAGRSSPATACGTGRIPNAGATACIWDGTTVCPAGTYINPKSSVITLPYCANCTAKNFCTGGSAAPAECAPGEYVNNASTACFTPTSCNPGDYLVGSTGCFPCPSGSACAGGVAAAVTCGAGQLPNVAKSACVASASTCTSGNFLYKVFSSDTVGICLPCPIVPGIIISCPAGNSGLNCPNDLNLGYTCQKCPGPLSQGSCSGNYLTCTTASMMASYLMNLYGVFYGYMLDDSGTECIPVPSGTCPEGSYENTTIGGLKVCDECPRGKFCPGKGAGARTCPPYLLPNATLVPNLNLNARFCRLPSTTCAAGSVLYDGICYPSTSTNLIPITSNGTLPSTALVSKCQEAVQSAIASGSVLASAFLEFRRFGAITNPKEWRCSLTVPGFCNPNPYPAFITNISASLCATPTSACSVNAPLDGTVTVSGNGVTGAPCSSGVPAPSCIAGSTWSNSGTSPCTACATCSGATSTVTSACTITSNTVCGAPPPTCAAGRYVSGSSCVLCPAGTYQSSSSFTGTSCTACPSGISSTNSATGSTSISACTICAPGYAGTVQCPPLYANTAICAGTSLAAGCTICPIGKYALAGASTCTDCAAGRWGATAGLTSASCTGTCGLGKYSTAGSSSCTDCPAGTWGATSGLQSSACSGTCPAGKYSTIGSSICTDCPAGLTSLPGSTSSSACVTPVSSCNAGSYLDQSTCVLCPAGTYQSSSSFTGSSCTSCPSGISTTGSATGSISVSDCTICAPGYAGSVTGSGTSSAAGCTICPLGKYALASASTCTNCPGGTWGATTGLTTSTCSGTCPAGTFSAAGSSSCSLCPAGSWGATPGMQNSGCSGVCADGKYATAGSSSCSDCPRGTWGIRGGVWNAPIGLTNASCSGTCPAGTTSAPAATASNWCSACTSGKYSLAGDPACILCPAGTWGQTIGLKTPACTGTCPAGKYSAAGAFMCSDCPSGQTSPVGSTSANACVPAVSCVAGSTWSTAGTAPCTACSTCSGANSVVSSACTVTADTVCSASTTPSGPSSCSAGSTWSSSGTAPCTACSTCTGPNRVVSTTCSVTSDAVCGCDSGSTVDAAGTGCLPTAVVVMPYSISSPTLCSAAGVVDSVLKPTSGVALSLRGNLSVALGIPSSAAFIVAVTACDSTTTLVAQNAPVNTAIVPGGIPGRRLQTAALNTSSLNLVIDGQTLVITLGFTIPTSVAPAMSAFLSASMSGTATPATMATLASNLQQSIQSSGAASSPQLSALLVDISTPSSSSSSSSSNAANAFSKRLNSVPVSAAAPMAASLGVSVASLGITNNTVKGVPSAIAVSGNPLAVSPTAPTVSPDSGSGGLGGLGALVLLVILPACGYYFFVYRKKQQQQGEAEKKKEGSDVDGSAAPSSSTIAVSSADISFDIVSPMHADTKKKDDSFQVVSPMHAKKEATANKASFEPKSVSAGPVEIDSEENKSSAATSSVVEVSGASSVVETPSAPQVANQPTATVESTSSDSV